MKRLDIIKRAMRNLLQSKARTFLTSLAIAVGAFTLTMALAAGQGTRDYADKLLKNNIDPQAMFVVKDKSLFEDGGTVGLREYDPDVSTSTSGRPGATIKMLNESDVDYLKSRSDLTDVIPVYMLSPKSVQFEGSDKRYIGAVDYYDATILTEATTGDLPPLGTQIPDGDIVVPQKYVTTLGVEPSALIGKKVSLTFMQQTVNATQDDIQAAFMSGGTQAVQDLLNPQEKVFTYTVRAVAKSPTMSFSATPRMLISAHSARVANDYQTAGSSGFGKYTGVSMLAKKDADPMAIKKDLESRGYAAQTAKDAQSILFTIVNTLQGIVAGFGLLTLLASLFGIINTQYISVLERTSQIGLMKALGMPKRGVAKLFRYEAAWIGFLGGAIGAGIALITGTFANPAISKWLDIGDDRILEFVWWQIAAMIGILVVIAIVAGWFPARKAARLDPIEALRTE